MKHISSNYFSHLSNSKSFNNFSNVNNFSKFTILDNNRKQHTAIFNESQQPSGLDSKASILDRGRGPEFESRQAWRTKWKTCWLPHILINDTHMVWILYEEFFDCIKILP